jgi:hypothetical protein
MTCKMLQKAAAERDDEAQAEWKAMRAHWVAHQIIVVDESSKDDCTIFCSWGHSFSGQCAMISANFV